MFNIIEKYQEALNTSHPDQIIDEIADSLEYEKVNREEIIILVDKLINQAMSKANDQIKESVFNAICNAVIYQNVAEFIKWDAFIDNISSINERYLEYIFICLGFSHEMKYISTLKSFLNHPNQDIIQHAQEAIQEIEFNIKRGN